MWFCAICCLVSHPPNANVLTEMEKRTSTLELLHNVRSRSITQRSSLAKDSAMDANIMYILSDIILAQLWLPSQIWLNSTAKLIIPYRPCAEQPIHVNLVLFALDGLCTLWKLCSWELSPFSVGEDQGRICVANKYPTFARTILIVCQNYLE